MFKQCMMSHLVAKRQLLWRCWKHLFALFLVVRHMSVEAWQLRSNNLFFFSSCFSLSSPQESCWPEKKKKHILSFVFFNQICSSLFWLLFFFWIILLIDFFNFIHLYLISFNFYINFDPRSFYYDFLIDLFFLFSSLNIQFHFIFILNLFLII